jgi:hypothetical protein
MQTVHIAMIAHLVPFVKYIITKYLLADSVERLAFRIKP